MPPVNLLKFSTSSPSDTTSFELLREQGYNPDHVLGVVGKTEGKGHQWPHSPLSCTLQYLVLEYCTEF